MSKPFALHASLLLITLCAVAAHGQPAARSGAATPDKALDGPLPAGGRVWLAATASNLLTGCQVKADDGTRLYTTDGRGNYGALWRRHFAYMVENAGDLLPADHVEACLQFLIRGIRADGAAPDRVRPDGVPVYAAGGEANPIGEPRSIAALDRSCSTVAQTTSLSCRGRVKRFRLLSRSPLIDGVPMRWPQCGQKRQQCSLLAAFQRMPPASHNDRSKPQGRRAIQVRESALPKPVRGVSCLSCYRV